MFENLLETSSIKIATVRAMLQTNDKLRAIVFGKPSLNKDPLPENNDFLELAQEFPGEIEWKIYDHCATVMRLYAIYERFVEDLISEWLQLLPELISSYSDLDETIQNTHREGIGRLLIYPKKIRFEDPENQNLSIYYKKVVQGFLAAISDHEKYELLPEIFIFHEQNLRKDALVELFTKAGIEKAWEWIIHYRQIKYFIEQVRGNQNTAEAELKQFIHYRNKAAHGSINEILGIQELLYLADFVEALCQALAELVTYQILLKKVSIGQAQKVGRVTEWFKKQKAAIVIVENITLSVGDKLFLVNEESSYCSLTRIESIQIDSQPRNEVKISSPTEVGLKFNIDTRKGFSLYLIN
ncbi:MAE_28990/MAE_18760 family HEPN-like nuclease [Planktothrix mougeotii]|uniref:RiboL-PSP-HEPN domain-containing protein n=1 Tax=Planktothrix mougeotii LEGE 06226 TaxID=1828728 RepID=A0ABR9UAF9_9CYAN|nr:MAE_28990/MAE_18760 family HEPN-like nuclease [Planktothrix mougeotii]MBE9143407.1 hypothetical protein [Planktothrix mougeotii LEGE 06226]